MREIITSYAFNEYGRWESQLSKDIKDDVLTKEQAITLFKEAGIPPTKEILDIKDSDIKPKEIGGQDNAKSNGGSLEKTGEQAQGVEQGTESGLHLRGDETQSGAEAGTGEEIKNFTTKDVINRDYAVLKDKLGEKKAQKYFQQADRLIDPNNNTIVEYRENGIVTKEGDKYVFNALAGTDTKEWRIGFKTDVTDQFVKSTISPESRQNGEITAMSAQDVADKISATISGLS